MPARTREYRVRSRPPSGRLTGGSACPSTGGKTAGATGVFALMSQVESTGTRVLESRYEETIAKPTANERGMNNWRPTPTMKNDGTKTESTHSIESRRGTAVLRHASVV